MEMLEVPTETSPEQESEEDRKADALKEKKEKGRKREKDRERERENTQDLVEEGWETIQLIIKTKEMLALYADLAQNAKALQIRNLEINELLEENAQQQAQMEADLLKTEELAQLISQSESIEKDGKYYTVNTQTGELEKLPEQEQLIEILERHNVSSRKELREETIKMKQRTIQLEQEQNDNNKQVKACREQANEIRKQLLETKDLDKACETNADLQEQISKLRAEDSAQVDYYKAAERQALRNENSGITAAFNPAAKHKNAPDTQIKITPPAPHPMA